MTALFGGAPKPGPTVRAPAPQDKSVMEAEQRKRREMQGMRGRESTILASASPTYSNKTLGE